MVSPDHRNARETWRHDSGGILATCSPSSTVPMALFSQKITWYSLDRLIGGPPPVFKRSFSAFVLCSALVLTTSINSSAANWKKLSPVDSPSARVSPMMAYDPVSQKVVLFGGVNTQYLSDTWTFDGVNWTQEHPASSPPARTSGNMAYDRVSRMLVLFGGYAGNGQYLRDTWLWDGATSSWIETNPRFAPTAVTAPLVFTDPKTGHAMTWGGFDGHLYQSTTWLWTGTSWRN